MKGKVKFDNGEKEQLREIINKYENCNSKSERKYLRDKMRKIGFYVSNYGISNITSNDFNKLFPSNKNKIISEKETKSIKKDIEIKSVDKFSIFNPLNDDPSNIPDEKGNYIIVLKNNSKLPKTVNDIIYTLYENKKVIYTGISNKSLRKRDYKQHFNGTAGNSTLRKSIGSMFGYKKIARDKVENGKTKFRQQDEELLSLWMKKNLELLYLINSNPAQKEQILIDKFNPPLNLSKNKNSINSKFRKELSQLRKQK